MLLTSLYSQAALLLLILVEEIWRVAGIRHTVYWNSTNPRFFSGDYTLVVHINDYLDILCPHYDESVPEEKTETFALYMVTWDGYEKCYETPNAFKRWICNKPYASFGPVRFSEKIQRFTPFSRGFEFQPAQPDEGSAGHCLKLQLSVCCKATTTKPDSHNQPNSQPRGGGGGGRIEENNDKGYATRSPKNVATPQSSESIHIYILFLILGFIFLWN
ncbi:ephrin-A4 isoform X2 [Protopterus annectens]|uniref:ephrin-A4 isoform X2 n=1 Tax=Protopterus annectens TaxID=7888 RepID=UPI001CF95B57|nr:ephrin-A4 isoform X2 [Protopterus annectens]